MNRENSQLQHTVNIISARWKFWKLNQLPENCTITISNGLVPLLVFGAAQALAKAQSKNLQKVSALDLATENDYAKPPLEIWKKGLKQVLIDCMWNLANVPDRQFVFFGKRSNFWSEITLFGINLLAPESTKTIFTESGIKERRQLKYLIKEGWIAASSKVLVERNISLHPRFPRYIEAVNNVENAWISFDIAHEWQGAAKEFPQWKREDQKEYMARVGKIILERVRENAKRIKSIEVSGWNISTNATHHEGAHNMLSSDQLAFVKEVVDIVRVVNPDLIIKHEPGHLDIGELRRVIEILNK